MLFSELAGEQIRQIIDCEQVFEAWRSARHEYENRYLGSMYWHRAGERQYLYRKIGSVRRSLGPRSDDTERVQASFDDGKERVRLALAGATARLNAMAPLLKALGVGRMPTVAAKIVRRLDQYGLLGKNIKVVGTHALYAFERFCGVFITPELLATTDVDLLYDSRTRLRLSGRDISADGIMGIIKQADASFKVHGRRKYQAINHDGFMVDLIMPHSKGDPILSKPQIGRIGTIEDDLDAIEIGGLAWLVSTPAFESVVIGEDGYPVRMVSPDPRAWAIHKLWLSDRPDRDPLKKRRDRMQGLLIVDLLSKRRPDMPFDDDRALSALPASLRERILKRDVPGEEDLSPGW